MTYSGKGESFDPAGGYCPACREVFDAYVCPRCSGELDDHGIECVCDACQERVS